MPSPAHDVVVAGAGPAGSTLALRLAAQGFSVALVEAQRFPRFKACGEFMSPACLPILRELGVLEEVARLGARKVRGMHLHGYGERAHGDFVAVGRAVPAFDFGWAVRREAFDAVLLDKALARGGIELVEGRVTGVLRDADGRCSGLALRAADGRDVELRASFTVGADGVRSVVAGGLGARRTIPWLDKIALTTRYAGLACGEHAEVHLFDGGYFACAPVDAGLLSLNLVLERSIYRRTSLPRDALLAHWLARVPALEERLAQGRRADPVRGTAWQGSRTTAQVFDGAALVGDAAGYVDPITGEGIYLALLGARLLAQSLVPALHARRCGPRALTGYARARRREIEARCRLAFLLQRGLRRPGLVRHALALLGRRPRLADLVVSLTGDYVPLGEIARPRVWLDALRAPARAEAATP
jgi:flavin-dependent dehydrogenase